MHKFFTNVRYKVYRYRRGCGYGLLEAIFWPFIDMWQRYATIADEIMGIEGESLSVLDVGGAGGIISFFLKESRYKLCLVDVDRSALGIDGKRMIAVVGDGCNLPFRKNVFDVVISVATIEHVPLRSRREFCEEIKRVAKSKVIIYTPLVDERGVCRAKEYDLKLYEAYKKHFSINEKKTAEHIKAEHPTLEEIKMYFPNAVIKYMQNCDVWLRCLILENKPIPLVNGLIYMLLLMKHDNVPPWYGCRVVYSK